MHHLTLIVGIAAIVAPSLHLLSDVMEWSAGGFSRAQPLVNYAAFVPMPFLLLGLYALQTPRSTWVGLLGAMLYGLAFVYFTHSTLVALEQSIPNYEILWGRLGVVYTVYGAMIIAGGLLFGLDALRARVLPRRGVILFLTGIGLNLVVGLTPLPDIVQIAGSTIRNVGLMAIGAGVVLSS
ncbi:MAG: hypothetical protein ABIX28_23820 [Vicinamibacterales bacterium]